MNVAFLLGGATLKAHREVWQFSIYCVKVDDSSTANDREKAVRGARGEPESNNLVYTKRPKDMYANRKHETTITPTKNKYQIVKIMGCG